MCVIMLAQTKRPTEGMITRGYNTNDQGAGIAWRQEGKVYWEKGLNLDEMQHLCATLPMPYVAHFRIASCGGQRPSLCHPFPIQRTAPLALKGSTSGYVLFHNGHWGDWKRSVLETVRAVPNFKIPTGKWSDTRAMAWYAAHVGLGVLEFIDEKTVAFGPSDIEIFGSGWGTVEEVLVSNTHFQFAVGGGARHHGGSDFHHQQHQQHRTMCRANTCCRKNINKDGWCPEHDPDFDPSSSPQADVTRLLGPVRTNASGTVVLDIVQAPTTGGSSTETPFVKLHRLGQEFAKAFKLKQTNELSNNQFKKARKRFEEQQEMIRKKFGQNAVPMFSLASYLAAEERLEAGVEAIPTLH